MNDAPQYLDNRVELRLLGVIDPPVFGNGHQAFQAGSLGETAHLVVNPNSHFQDAPGLQFRNDLRHELGCLMQVLIGKLRSVKADNHPLHDFIGRCALVGLIRPHTIDRDIQLLGCGFLRVTSRPASNFVNIAVVLRHGVFLLFAV